MSKSECQRKHAKRRFKQRLGLELNRKEYRNMVNKIQKGKYEFLEKRSNRVSLFEAKINDTECALVYDKSTKNIVTVLYLDA